MLTPFRTFRLLTAILVAIPAYSQIDAKVTGVIQDQDGKVIVGATIDLVGQRTSEKRKEHSDKDGQFAFSQIPPDTYQITGNTKEGADASTSEPAKAGRSHWWSNTKSSSSVISLHNNATTIELGSASLSANVTTDEVAALPVNGRTFGPLALSAPLVTNSGDATLSEIRFAGQPVEQNRYRVDGIDVSSVVTSYRRVSTSLRHLHPEFTECFALSMVVC